MTTISMLSYLDSKEKIEGFIPRRLHTTTSIQTFQTTSVIDVAIAAPIMPQTGMSVAFNVTFSIAAQHRMRAAVRSFPVMLMRYPTQPHKALTICSLIRITSYNLIFKSINTFI